MSLAPHYVLLLTATLFGLLPVSGLSAAADKVLTLATTTSTDNSGLLAYLHPDFEKKTGILVKVIAKGTGAALQLARDGNADVVLVHARAQEDKFIAEGYGVTRHAVMHNDFVILGPPDDPAGVQTAKRAGDALVRIARTETLFLSRGDGSGTHIKEQELWRASRLPLQTERVTQFLGGARQTTESVRPGGKWYRSIGQGMGKTIIVATEQRAYTLADRGTYYALALAEPPRTDLVILCEGGRSLYNPYGVIAVNPQRHPRVNFEAAGRYIRWITSAEVQGMIGRYRVGGEVLFHPDALPNE